MGHIQLVMTLFNSPCSNGQKLCIHVICTAVAMVTFSAISYWHCQSMVHINGVPGTHACVHARTHMHLAR